jgi:CRISPR-associated protein Cas6
MLELQRSSRLRIRLETDQIEKLLPLVGADLVLDGVNIRLGAPTVEKLRPSVQVRSRIVVIKGFVEPDPFLGAVSRQLQALEIAGRPGIPFRKDPPLPGSNKSPLIRRTLRIRDKVVVGFCVTVEELTAEESIVLQEAGIGGRRRFGCGLFLPAE